MGFTLVAGWMILFSAARADQAVTLAWSPGGSPNIAGYRVYTRVENSILATSTNVGSQTQVTLPGLKEGLRYTFTVKSYNALGLESLPSNSAVFTVPVPLHMLPPATRLSPKRLHFPIAPGKWYEVQASTDLRNWTTIWQTSVATSYTWLEFQDIQSVLMRSRYYRLKVH